MLKYLFSSLLFFLSFVAISQEKKKDSVMPISQRYGLRIGADISKLVRSGFDKNYKGVEFVADYRLTKKIYLAGEIGNENKITNDDRINFTTKGTYFKVGFDSNSYQNWLDMENLIHVGLRYGVSSFSQEINSYKTYNTATYFPQAPINNIPKEFNGLTAHWAEVVAGMKAEVFNNVFMGFSFRINYLVSNKKPDNFDNLYIPGFNRTYDGKFGVGFNYTVSYFIPFYKKTTKKEAPVKLDSKVKK